MKALTTITLRGSHKLLRVGSIRSPAALPRMAVRGRAFLSERADDIRFRYYKGGLSEASPPTACATNTVGSALCALAHPTLAHGSRMDEAVLLRDGRSGDARSRLRRARRCRAWSSAPALQSSTERAFAVARGSFARPTLDECLRHYQTRPFTNLNWASRFRTEWHRRQALDVPTDLLGS
jgi:hypothetical protein